MTKKATPATPAAPPAPPPCGLTSMSAETFLAVSARLGHIPTVRQCIAWAQSQWKDPAADTEGMVGHRTFRYAKLEEYLDQIRTHLNTLGCSVEQPWDTHHDEAGNWLLTIVTTITGPGGDALSKSLTVPIPADASIKDLGSLGTFCRRYQAMAILGFGKDEDVDSDPDVPADNARGNRPLAGQQPRQPQPGRRRQPQPARARNLDDFERGAPAGGGNPQPAATNGQQAPPPLPRLERGAEDDGWIVRAEKGAKPKDRVTVTSPRTGEQREVELVKVVGSGEGTEDWTFSEPLPAAAAPSPNGAEPTQEAQA